MKIKLCVGLIALSLFFLLTLSQISRVNAQNANSPITSPITFTSFKIRGDVQYKFLRSVPILNRIYIIPAANVVIQAINRATNNVTTAKTDEMGNYSLDLQRGQYALIVIDPKATSFVPRRHNLEVTSDMIKVDSNGYIKYSLSLAIFNQALGSTQGQTNYNPQYDANNDGLISIIDSILLAPLLIN